MVLIMALSYRSFTYLSYNIIQSNQKESIMTKAIMLSKIKIYFNVLNNKKLNMSEVILMKIEKQLINNEDIKEDLLLRIFTKLNII